jgi:flavin reductase (DIM6/NTAB) family NADH-FMN oxidoreductase RutF
MSITRILGRLPSGLFVLTAAREGRDTGMLASWVMQAGFEPPMVTAAIRHGRFVADWLTAGQPFVLNVLAPAHKGLLSHFASGFGPEEPAFEGLQVGRSESGLPVLEQSLGHMECVPKAHFDSGDHRIFLAEVVSGLLASEEGPMVHIRKSGMHY